VNEESLGQGRASTGKLILRLLGEGLQYRWRCLGVLSLHLLLVALSLSGLGLTGVGIDFIRHHVDPSSAAPNWPFGLEPPAHWPPMAVVALLAGCVFALALTNATLRYTAALTSAGLSQQMLIRVRTGVYAKLQRLSFHFYDAGESSSIINRAAGDANAVRNFVDGVLIRMLTVLLTVLVYLVYMFQVHVTLTIVCLLTSPLLWCGAVIFSRIVQPEYRRASELGDELVRTLVESVQGIHVVKGFAAEGEQIARFHEANQRIRAQKESIFWKVSTFQPLMGLLTQVNMLVLIGYGGYLVIRGQLALGSGLFVFAGLLREFANQVGQITNVANTIQRSLISAQRVFEVLDAPIQISSPPDAVPLPAAQGAIAFEGVSFGYRPGQTMLHDVSFAIEPGECIGITGETGAGKSTLLSLIMRFYDVQHGRVQVDGIDVRRLDLDDLRRNIGIVFQDSFLFSTTVADNIAFGHPQASQEHIERAAQTAAAHEFVTELPEGYQTLVGEYGANLSGGQRQRLALARALLPDPVILLLDDATAAVDPATEHDIREAVESARQRRTTIVVSNRLSMLRGTDRTIVLDGGRIVDTGTHDELFERCAYYRRLAELQFAESADEAVGIGV
jgi:ATP-binding cassette subfamily B protein